MGLIVTGGIGPNAEGATTAHAVRMETAAGREDEINTCIGCADVAAELDAKRAIGLAAII